MIDAKKPVKLPTQQILPIVGLIVGIVFLYIGLSEFGFWNSNTHTPTAAFFSTIVSVGLIALSLIALLQSIRKPMEEFRLLNWYVPIGFLPSSNIPLSFSSPLSRDAPYNHTPSDSGSHCSPYWAGYAGHDIPW